MSLIRAFIAVDIPAPLQQALQRQTEPLRHTLGTRLVRWVDGRNIHLTLRFLGDISAAQVDALIRSLQLAADEVPAFDLTISGLGSFPSLRRARVLWAGIQAPAELEALNRGIESACRQLGYEAETKGFHPHLTLGRVQQGLSTAEMQKIHSAMEALTIDVPGPARVDSVHLYKSDLKPSGAMYTKLYSAPLLLQDRIHSALPHEVKSERT